MSRNRFVPSLLVVPAFLLFTALAFFGCGSSKGNGICPNDMLSCGQRCLADMPPSECNQACDASNPCPSGFYCGTNGTCTADCLVSGDALCPNGVCTVDGHCVEPPDSGNPPDGAVDAGPEACARQSVNATAVTPNVIFIIDRSGSMQWEFDLTTCSSGTCTGSSHTACNLPDPGGIDCDCSGGGNPQQDCYSSAATEQYSRWDELRHALVGTSGSLVDVGMIGQMEDQVRFGAVTFQGPQNGEPCFTLANFSPSAADATKYSVVDVGAVPDARSEIADGAGRYFAASPNGGTPTGSSIQSVLDNLGVEVTGSTDPTIFILATDGDPNETNSCWVGGSGAGSDLQSAVNAIANAYTAGIRTFVLAVADPADISQTNIDQMANVGIGNGQNDVPAATSWRITSVDALNAALQTIIQGEISCTVNLQGMVTDISDGCAGGMVDFVNGSVHTPVACDPTNGWTLTSPTTVELRGTSCDTLKNTPGLTLEASFPCGTVQPIPG